MSWCGPQHSSGVNGSRVHLSLMSELQSHVYASNNYVCCLKVSKCVGVGQVVPNVGVVRKGVEKEQWTLVMMSLYTTHLTPVSGASHGTLNVMLHNPAKPFLNGFLT